MEYYECYTDESGTSKPHKYMVLGGLILKKSFSQDFDKMVNELKEKNGLKPSYEFKWKKIESPYLDRYKMLIDLLHTHKDNIHYKSIVIDREKLNHRKFNNNDHIMGYYKYHYQLMIHCFGKYFKNHDQCSLYIDKSQVNYNLNEYRAMLNNGLRLKKKYAISSDIIQTVLWKDSKKSNHIQAADVLTGGLRLCLNLKYIDGKPDIIKDDKKFLADYICKKWGISNPFRNTFLNKQDFSIWHILMQK